MASRGVLVEETVPPHFEALLTRRLPYEVGLLIGKLAVGSRDFVLAVVPTPSADGEPPAALPPPSALPAGKKGKAGGAAAAPTAALPVDEEWISEHARQVGRMLPGGLCVLGLYAFCGDAAFRAAAPALARAAAALPEAPSFAGCDAFLLLHADAGARAKLSARRGEALKPAEAKLGRAWAQFHCVAATFRVRAALPAGGAAPLRAAAADAVAREAARAAAAEVTWQGALPAGSDQVGTVLGAAGALGDADASAPMPPPAELALWPPPSCVALAAAPLRATTGARDDGGIVLLDGVIAARAYVYAREPFSRAAADLKADVATSLAARLELLLEEAERAEEAGAAVAQPALLAAASAAPAGGLALPRRVALPWRAGAALCDYLLPGEGPDAAAERAAELLGAPLAAAPQPLEAEAAPPAPPATPPPPAGAAPKRSAAQPATGDATAGGVGRLAAAAAVAALAAGVGYLVVHDDDYFDLF